MNAKQQLYIHTVYAKPKQWRNPLSELSEPNARECIP